jgi:hypothetical protein
MGDRARGLYNKYLVYRVDRRDRRVNDKHSGCRYFVLDLTHDPHAKPALLAYAASARADGYTALADDLEREAAALRGKP